MASISVLLPSAPVLASRRMGMLPARKRREAKVWASRSEAQDRNQGGRMVDESMVVLRKRIQEVKMAERSYEPPAEWMGWERKHYPSYNQKVAEMAATLQSVLRNTRPSLAFGVVALFTLSLPVSSAVVLYNLVEIVKAIVNGIHAG